MANSKTKQAWADMKSRCNNKNHMKFYYYGYRGISYDAGWAEFSVFLRDMGEAPTESCLDRIDCNADYSKANCRWTTKRESARNTRSTKLTPRKVSLIRALLRSIRTGVTRVSVYRAIAPLFGVSWYSIRSIDRGENWSEVV